jgi:alpha-galactosidase
LQEGKLAAGFGCPVKGPKIGPEYTFGLTLEKQMNNPILLIKTAWGGQNISLNFRPPSAGPKKLLDWQIEAMKAKGKNPEEKQAELNELSGHRYRDMMKHVNDVLANIKRVYPDYDPEQGYEIAGFVWFQGWNDKVDKFTYSKRDEPGGYDLYSELLTTFIKDVRKDLKAPKMPFVIGVMGVDGKIDVANGDQKAARNQRFRDAMAAPAKLPEFQGNVHAVWTENYWDNQLGALEIKRTKTKEKLQAIKRNKKLSDEERKKMSDDLRAATFTPEEQSLYDHGISNFGFHYLGSAKMIGHIGIAFAEALAAKDTK